MKNIFRKYEIIFTMLLFAITPVINCFIMCLKDGIHLNDIYLASSSWNDEILYYKLVESIAKYGEPLGYFGYNESFAATGHFGPWSPVLFLFFIIYAKVFGWSMLAPIYCNIVLITVGMAAFAYLVKPTKLQSISICLMYSTCTIITRYILSAMPEVTIFALLIVFTAFSVRLYNEKTDFKISYIIALDIIAILMVLMRPYWLLLFIVPGCFAWKKTRKNILFYIEIAMAVVSIVTYFFITNNYCSPYFYDLINTSWLELLFSSPSEGIYNILHILFSSIWDVLQSAGNGILYGYTAGTIYALYLIMMGYIFYKLKERKNKRIWDILAFSFCTMLLAIFFLYDINVGSRHILGFIVIFIFVLSEFEETRKIYYYFLIGFVCIFCIKATEEYTYSIPQYSAWKAAVNAKGHAEMISMDMLNKSTDNSWDNTIIWLIGDETQIDFTYLYAIPEGIGINCCLKDYVLENFTELKSKYILTNIGEETDLLCEQQGKEMIAYYGNVHVWKLR